jgi:8-oxo-dGTP pyrophosphatase MutT (NUDIX family)
MNQKIYKIGLIVIKDNRLLLCEPYAFSDLILPGGVKEGDESHVDNLVREVFEELGPDAILEIDTLEYLGNFEDLAAGRPGRTVEIELYAGSINGDIVPSSEIKEIHWFSKDDDHSRLSVIIRNKILPFLIENKYIL